MKKKRRSFEIFSLSFLDVISCGFGAIVLLLVIMKISEPAVIENTTQDIQAKIEQYKNDSETLQKESANLFQTIEKLLVTRDDLQNQLTALQQGLSQAKKNKEVASIEQSSHEVISKQLYRARQELTKEMQRLQGKKSPSRPDAPIGGVPVDSEYIIFVIDTSGSMQQFAWLAVRRKMQEILQIYPRVKGIQVMNDMGDYMFSQYSGRWITDTPARRRAILQRLRNWSPFSNSSPVEGVTAAIRRFYAADKKISIYIFGDDFSRGSIQEVVETVDAINQSLTDGSRRVRIHAVGFPVLFGQPGAELNVARFAALMRRLAEDNDGSFVGLTNTQ
ncbi:MAG: VWA domain-containing protein [Deltaproteobacteria bacterium]|nr:VWA domain-containing protein [Deltaproteobacteria bacterium]